MSRTLLLLLAVALACPNLARAAAQPVVFWASTPVRPDETVLVQGSDLGGADTTVELARLSDDAKDATVKDWTRVRVLQANANQSLKFAIPADWPMGVYAARVTTAAGASAPVTLNAPEAWWLQGDEGETASPGGWLRVHGLCLTAGAGVAPAVRLAPEEPIDLRQEGKPLSTPRAALTLAPEWADENSLHVRLPANLADGEYGVSVHNGRGRQAGWRLVGRLKVKPAPAPPGDTFSVLDSYGPDAISKQRETLIKYREPLDRTEGVRAALDKAKKNGGGVVYFPAGRYTLKGKLDVPPRTTLRGEGQGLVTIWWGTGHFNLDGGGDKGRKLPEGTPKPPSPLISGPDWSIEDLTLYLPVDYEQCLVADERFRMSRVKIRIDHYWLVQGRGNGTVARMGKNFQITDCDVLAKGDTLSCGQYGLIARNHIASNKSMTPLGGAREVIVEHNLFTSMDPTAYQNIAGVGRDLYYGHNKQEAFYGHQSDFSFTFDASSGAYCGKLAKVDGTHVTLANDPTYPKWAPETHKIWRRAVISVLDGRGAGQWRDVTANAGRDWTTDRPFDVAPDDASVVTITPFNGRVIVADNAFEDGNWVNAGYGISIDVVCARNDIRRCASVMNYGVHSQDWYQPSWHVQYFDNAIREGNTGVGSNGAGRTGEAYSGPLTACAVHRRHTIAADNFGGIGITGVLRDAVVEGCTLKNPAGAIKADNKATGVLFRDNRFTGDKPNYTGDGAKDAVVK
jgi:hypothetical protein